MTLTLYNQELALKGTKEMLQHVSNSQRSNHHLKKKKIERIVEDFASIFTSYDIDMSFSRYYMVL